MRKIWMFLVIMITGLLVFSGCEKKTEEAATGGSDKYGGKLRYIYAFSPGTNFGWPLDDANMQRGWGLHYMVSEPLVTHYNDGTVKPVLATSWEFADDYSSITFNLRKGVKFHDGTHFNADAVKWQLDLLISEKKLTAASWKSVDKLGDHKIRINFKEYINTFWDDISGTHGMFVSPTQYKEKGLEYAKNHPCGTGPFLYVSFARDENMEFKKNPHYWEKGKPYLDEIEFITVKEPMTQLAAMRAGDGEVLGIVVAKDLKDMKNEGYQIVTGSGGGGAVILVPDSANEDSVYKDIRVRKALDHAINKKAIAEALGHGYMAPIAQIATVGSLGHDTTIQGRAYDPEKAKQLLADAGYPNGFKTVFNTWEAGGVPLAIQQDLKKVGIDAEVNMVDVMKFWQFNREGWTGLMFSGYGLGANLASAIKGFLPPYSVIANKSLGVPANMKELIDTALSATELEEQKKRNRMISRALWEEASLINVVSDKRGYVINTKVQDIRLMETSDFFYWNPKDVWLAK